MEQCLQLVDGEERGKIDSHTHTAGQMRRHQGPRFSPGYVHFMLHTLTQMYNVHLILMCFYLYQLCAGTLENVQCMLADLNGLTTTHTDKSPYLPSDTCSRGERTRRRDFICVCLCVCVSLVMLFSPSTSCCNITAHRQRRFIMAFVSCQSEACK